MISETLLRAAVYLYFSAAFRYPDEDTRAFLLEMASHARSCLERLGRPVASLETFIAEVGRIPGDELGACYVRTFVNGNPSVIVSPCESHHVPDSDRLSLLARLTDSYNQCGVDLSLDYREMPDHIATELEFMHYLCVEEINSPRDQAEISGFEIAFVRQHLVPFVQSIQDRLPDGVYNKAVNALQQFVVAEGLGSPALSG